ncbi:MAG TPA: hypothetical protein VLM85_09215 [Polyangiaceae bacterium]|nr:hypothetical protein [Polyangiaceae bacterium]
MVSRALACAVGLATAACAPTGTIGRPPSPGSETVPADVKDVPVTGSVVSIELADGSTVSGELLAAQKDSLALRVGKNTVELVAATAISHVDVTLYSNSVAVGALSAWAFVGTASSLTHGWGFVLTGPAWAVLSTVTILPVGLDTRRVARAVGDLGQLYVYARFPQGLPLDYARRSVRAESAAAKPGGGD